MAVSSSRAHEQRRRENERRSGDINRNQVVPAPIFSLSLCPRPPLFTKCAQTKTAVLRRLSLDFRRSPGLAHFSKVPVTYRPWKLFLFAVFAPVQDQSYNKGVFIIYPVGGGGGARQNHEGDRNVGSASLGGGVWGDSYCVNIISGGRCQNCNNNNNSYNANVFYNTWAFEGWNQRWRAALLRHIVIWVGICAEGTLTWLSQTFELYRFHQFSLKVEACCL